MEKSEFLALFKELVREGDIQIDTAITSDECFGERAVTTITIDGEVIIQSSGDVDLGRYIKH